MWRLKTLASIAKVNIRQTYRHSSQLPQLKMNDIDLMPYLMKLREEYSELIQKDPTYANNSRCAELKTVVNLLERRDELLLNLAELEQLKEDPELSKLVVEERNELESKLYHLDDSLTEALCPMEKADEIDAIVLEVQAGVGGKEAMLFAQEMYDMYCNFITHKGWSCEVAEYSVTELGGLRYGSLLVEGRGVYRFFKYEAGVHRVQRIPVTEKSGRVHTSTISVVALAQPTEIDIVINTADLKIETKRSSGAGGQHVNTTDSAVRITHLPTNISVECQVDRSQIKNRKLAMARLRALLYQKNLDEQTAQIAADKKSQVRSSNRNEKIRTYNYNQDRITDHRLKGVHIHNLKGFMGGGEDLENLIEQLDKQRRMDTLLEIVAQYS